MFFLLGLLIGLALMYLIAGFIVYSIATKQKYNHAVNDFFQDDKKVGIGTLLTWPSDVSRMANAGLTTGHELVPRLNVNKGGPQPPPGAAA
jgi:hypothetical protein